MPEFSPKKGVPYSKADAENVCPAILAVMQECGGACDKDDILAAARRRGSPLRPYVFNKPQGEAAEYYYREQAAKLLRSFEVVFVSGRRRRRVDLVYYVELVQPETAEGEEPAEVVGSRRRNRNRKCAFVDASAVLEDPAYQQQVLAAMQQELAAFRSRYEEFAELVDFRTRFGRIFRSICEMFDEAA